MKQITKVSHNGCELIIERDGEGHTKATLSSCEFKRRRAIEKELTDDNADEILTQFCNAMTTNNRATQTIFGKTAKKTLANLKKLAEKIKKGRTTNP